MQSDRIGQTIGPYDDILTTVKKRKLKWFGHVSRSAGLAKTILQGTVQGGSVASVPAPLSEFSGSALLTLSGLQSKDVIGW